MTPCPNSYDHTAPLNPEVRWFGSTSIALSDPTRWRAVRPVRRDDRRDGARSPQTTSPIGIYGSPMECLGLEGSNESLEVLEQTEPTPFFCPLQATLSHSLHSSHSPCDVVTMSNNSCSRCFAMFHCTRTPSLLFEGCSLCSTTKQATPTPNHGCGGVRLNQAAKMKNWHQHTEPEAAQLYGHLRGFASFEWRAGRPVAARSRGAG